MTRMNKRYGDLTDISAERISNEAYIADVGNVARELLELS